MSSLAAFEPLGTAPVCQNPLGSTVKLKGRAATFDDNKRANQIRLLATLDDVGPLDLSAATVTLDRLLHEVGGLQELAKDQNGSNFLPMTLTAAPGSTANRGHFDSGPGSKPRVLLTLRRQNDGRLNLFLKVRFFSLPDAPSLCGGEQNTTTISTRLLSIDDAVNQLQNVPISADWECRTDSSGAIHKLRVSTTP
jgi:hypothetical protein